MNGRYEAKVAARRVGGSSAHLVIGRAKVATRPWAGMRKGVRVSIHIRPEDVLLCAGDPGRISARNVLPGEVRKLAPRPEGVYVTVDVGFPLVALVTREAVADLAIRPGARLHALVKATAIAPLASTEAPVRLSLVGKKGEISSRRVEFLRVIARLGSIAAAAREAGITYRAAWLWMREINRAWGEPLVSRMKGGHGGGGAALTPAGHTALAVLSRHEQAMSRSIEHTTNKKPRSFRNLGQPKQEEETR